MLKSKQDPPVQIQNFQKPRRDRSVGPEREKEHSQVDPNHWSLRVSESLVSALPDQSLHVTLLGGADNGYFLYLDDIDHTKIIHHSGCLESGNIVLEIQGQRIAGYTLRDAMILLKQASQNGSPVMIKSVNKGQLPKDLQQYLGSRFPKASIDHNLQQTIRDNLYLRTVPCTTRKPRAGEVNGVDYTFVTYEQFQELEKSGCLLESGIFDGNLYGTPKPPKDSHGHIPRRSNSLGNMLPGQHPSLETKMRRNHSNTDIPLMSASSQRKIDVDTPAPGKLLESSDSDARHGPLPHNWETAFIKDGQKYFINHNTEQTYWRDPRLANKPELSNNELPFGWEKVVDPHYGTYYIDHVNKKTQYEHPGAAPKFSVTADEINNSSTLPRCGKNGDTTRQSPSEPDINGSSTPPVPLKRVFVRNPDDLLGDRFTTRLLKGERGLGFIIIGGNNPDEQFLQIKNVEKNGPAYVDGKLQTGDVIVRVNGQLVLGYTYEDAVQFFQTIQPGDFVDLEVCRGYPLPFNPDDPNTEIITRIAVGYNDKLCSNSDAASYSSRENWEYQNDTSSRSLKSLPELVKSASTNQAIDHSQSNMPGSSTPGMPGQTPPEILSIDIVRGDTGFGFTIADSVYGQKVKQILDRPRCKNLQEGDFIQQINGVLAGDMNHSQVVQVLKDCPIGVETRLTVQRGGISSKGRKPTKITENQQDEPSFSSNQPGANFFSEKSDKMPDNTGGYMNMSRVRDELDSNSGPPEIPMRPRTPKETQRPKTPSETRPKTPTRLPLYVDNSRPTVTSASSTGAHLYRKEFLPPDNSRKYADHASDGANNNIGLHPPPGPKIDPFRPETGSWSDFKSRTNHSVHNSYDRDPRYGRGNNARPGQFRSKTPGPELMMQRSQVPDSRPEPNRPKTPTASDMRSKTPVPGLYGYVPGENPEFARNADLQNSWAVNQSVPHSSGRHFQGSGILDKSVALHMQRQEMTDTLGRMTTSALMSAGHPLGQSAPEREEPSYGSVNHAPYESESIAPLINQLKQFNYPGNAEDNVKFTEMNVNLHRQESGFGFRIVGGMEEGSQVAIGHIVPGGAADQDGRLQTGDEILFCDGVCVIDASHHKVVQMMGLAGNRGQVSLGIRRRILPHSSGYPYDVVVTRRENEGFGFVIISSVNKSGSSIGEFIGRILENSPAERCGHLHVGDRILAVNNMDILHLHHEDIVSIIKESGSSVTLTVGPALDDISSSSTTSQKGSRGSALNAVALPASNDMNGRPLGYKYPPPSLPPKDVNRSRIPSHQNLLDNQIYIVELNRSHRGFGFSIRGGQEFNNMPLFVLRIAEGGAADMDHRLRVGDQLLQINGYSTENMTHSEAIDIIQNGGPTLRLLAKRTGKPPPNIDSSISTPTVPMSNDPIGQSSPYLRQRNMKVVREDHLYYNQTQSSRTYLNN